AMNQPASRQQPRRRRRNSDTEHPTSSPPCLPTSVANPPEPTSVGLHAALWTLALTTAVTTAACDDTTDDCTLAANCTQAQGGSAGQSGVGGQGGMGQGGAGGGTPTACIPSEVDGVVDDSCGVFVSSSLGDDNNAGDKAAPFATITAALAAANGRAVYLCG